MAVEPELSDLAVFQLEADGGAGEGRAAVEAEGGPFGGGEGFGELGGGGLSRGPGIGVCDDVAAGLACEGVEAAALGQECGVVGGIGHLGLRVHVVEEVDAVCAAGEQGRGGAADGFEGVELEGAVSVIGAEEEFEAGGKDDAWSCDTAPEFERDIGFDGGPEGSDGEELDEAFAGPERAVESEGEGGLRPGGDARTKRDGVAATLLPAVEESTGAAHELGEEGRALKFAAGLEVKAEAHPVELETVEVVALGVFFDEAEVVFANGGVREVEGVVAPVGGGGCVAAPGQAAELGVLAPEGAVHVAVGVVDVVKVVHAHGDPRRETMAAGPGDPELVGVDLLLGERPGGVHPLAGAGAGCRRGGAEERLVVGALRIVAEPDGVPDLAVEAGALRVGGKDQFADLGSGVLIDEGGDELRGDGLAGAGEEPVAIVLVEGEGG